MGKSLRSKTKRAYRAKKRDEGLYAASAAARLHRLNAKLLQATKRDKIGDTNNDEEKQEDVQYEPASVGLDDSMQDHPDTMTADTTQPKVSTHGPRGSRRGEWRKSKGLSAHPSRHGMNRQGGLAARTKPGRAKRRR